MERRDECIELLKELKNCMEDYTGNKTVANNITLITNVSYDSAKFVIDQAISILENENPSEMGKTLIDASYERGLKDAWECAKKMFEMPYIELQNIFPHISLFNPLDNVSPSEAIVKIKEYDERKKQDEEIKVGDEVVYLDRVFVVTSIVKNEYVMGFDSNGEHCSYHYKTKLKKTGRTFPQIVEVLKQIKEK